MTDTANCSTSKTDPPGVFTEPENPGYTPFWRVERVTVRPGDHLAEADLEILLDGGWEPFAATSGPAGFTYHLRKEFTR